jgi:hypothetical protein
MTFDKGKVEAGVGHAQKTPLKGQRFESLEEAQAYLDRWETNWADTRIHGTTKRQVAAMFAEEQPHLLPLPLEPFRFYQYGQRVVHLDGCVEVEAAYYGAPPGWIGRRVQVHWDDLNVRLINPHTGQLLREHLRQKRGWHRIQEADRSPRTPPSTLQLLERASQAGTHIGELCQAIHQRQGQVGVRRILGVLSLAKKFGPRPKADSLFNCTSLKELFINRYDGKNIIPFTRLFNLVSLAILNAPIETLSGLSVLKKLRSLRLARLNCLTSLDGVEGLVNLEELEIQRCRRIGSVQQVGSLSKLRQLHLNDDGDIESLKPLTALNRLESILFYESTNILDGDRVIVESWV